MRATTTILKIILLVILLLWCLFSLIGLSTGDYMFSIIFFLIGAIPSFFIIRNLVISNKKANTPDDLFIDTQPEENQQDDIEVARFVSTLTGSDLMLSPDDIEKIVNYSKEVNDDTFNTEAKVIEKLGMFIEAWRINNGQFQGIPMDFIPQKGEMGLYKSQGCETLERKLVTRKINYAGPRLRINIAKGLSYNIGSMNISTSKSLQDVSHGVGVINITTKRVIFKSDIKTFTIPFNSIIQIEPYNDAVMVYKKSGNPLIFKTSNPAETYVYLNAAIKAH